MEWTMERVECRLVSFGSLPDILFRSTRINNSLVALHSTKKKYFEILATLFTIQFSPCCHSTLFWLVRCSTFAVLSPHLSIIILPSRFCWQSTIFSLALSSHWLLYSSNLNERDTYFGAVIERERESLWVGVAALPIEQEFEIFINSPFAKHHRFTWRRFYSGYLRRIEKLKRRRNDKSWLPFVLASSRYIL